MHPFVGQLYRKSKNPSDANCSSRGRLSSARISLATAFGKNSDRTRFISMSASVVPIHGMASNVRILEILRSINIFSSASDAMLLRGPIRTQIRPRYLTGGNSDGLTSTTSKSPPSKTKRSTVITGCGRILPSVRILVILSSRPSSTRRPDNFPLSSAPIIR